MCVDAVKLVMESIHNTLHLYNPLSERSCRGTDSSLSASLKPPRVLPEEEVEEEKPSFHLAGFREILQVLDDFCEIRQLAEVLRLHFHCRAVVDVGNQQGVKGKPCCRGFGFIHDGLPKSRCQVLKNRRAKGGVYTNNKIAVRLPPVPSKTSHPSGVRDLQIICRSLLRKGRTIRGPPELQPSWKARTDFPFTKHLSSRNSSSVILQSSPPDSDTDWSENESEQCSSSGNLESVKITKDNRCPPTAKKIQPGGDGDWVKAAGEEKHSSLWMKEEKEKKAAAQRLMGKMEELSSGWMDEGGDGSDEARSVMNGEAQRGNLKRRQMFLQDTGYSDEERHLKEFQALGEALSQSLRQVLKMEAAKADRDPSIETEEPSRSTKGPLTFCHDFTSAESVSPLLTSSPTEQLEKSTSEGHNLSLSQHAGQPEQVPTVLEPGPERASQENLELSDQVQAPRCTSENGALLASGNNAKLPFIYFI